MQYSSIVRYFSLSNIEPFYYLFGRLVSVRSLSLALVRLVQLPT